MSRAVRETAHRPRCACDSLRKALAEGVIGGDRKAP